MTQMNMLQAINNALDTAMAANERVLCFGEDVGIFGGVFRATSNLQQKYGKARCFNTPLVEQGIVDTDSISRKTGAISGCGSCDYDIENLLDELVVK